MKVLIYVNTSAEVGDVDPPGRSLPTRKPWKNGSRKMTLKVWHSNITSWSECGLLTGQ